MQTCFIQCVFSVFIKCWEPKPPRCSRTLQPDKSLERMRGLGQTLGATAPRGARHLSAGTDTSESHGQRGKKGKEPGNVSKQMRADCGLESFLR